MNSSERPAIMAAAEAVGDKAAILVALSAEALGAALVSAAATTA